MILHAVRFVQSRTTDGSPDYGVQSRGTPASMKKLLELLVCFIHPLAVVLAWIDLARRDDIGGIKKLVWGVFVIVPVVPFLYVLTGGDLW